MIKSLLHYEKLTPLLGLLIWSIYQILSSKIYCSQSKLLFPVSLKKYIKIKWNNSKPILIYASWNQICVEIDVNGSNDLILIRLRWSWRALYRDIGNWSILKLKFWIICYWMLVYGHKYLMLKFKADLMVSLLTTQPL